MPVAHYFAPQLESQLLMDTSRSGIGYALIQEGRDRQEQLDNQLGHFLPDLAMGTVHMWGLLRKRIAWVWTPDHENKFIKL